ncbi:MAG: sensor domain-containing diguanylate cyclase [Planctomycetes bacterium]|nr:sensor domain-containing diguanylate cyclase [Planctomycetota bacterium]
MPDNTLHVLLITEDSQLRERVRQNRPPAARLRCITPGELDSQPPPRAEQYWVDLDCAPNLDLPPCSRRVSFHSQLRRPENHGRFGLLIRKPCTPAMLDVLWAGVTPASPAPTRGPAAPALAAIDHLPGWLLDFHELKLRELCHKCVALLPPRLGYADASLYLHNFEQGVLALAETNHTRPVDLAVHLRDDRNHLMVSVARSGSILVTDDVSRDYETHGIRSPRRRQHYGDGACLIAPLLASERLWGIVNLSRPCRTSVTMDTPPLAAIFAFISRSLHHARVYDRAATEARVDGLTSLYNYRWIIETLAKEVRRAQRFSSPLSLIMVDLDGLKTVNDGAGHAAGDLLLRHVAGRITAALRQFDSAARVGGDEFVALLPRTDLAGAKQVAHRIMKTIREDAALFRGTALPITASMGVAQWEPGWDANSLIEAADKAMYQAKSQGRNRLACQPTVATESEPAKTTTPASETVHS